MSVRIRTGDRVAEDGAGAFPPGPRTSLLDALVYRMARHPLVFFPELARTYGDLVHHRLGGERC